MSAKPASAMNAAYRLLSYRGRSVRELRDRLKQKDFTTDTISRVVQELTLLGYLDDEKFARDYGGSLARNKKVGPRYILQSLARKGVKREIARSAVDELFDDPANEEREIKKLVEDKIALYKKSLTPLQKKKRIYNLLIRRGFSHHAVMQAISRKDFSR